jgi:CubicO group peptidase (beta-lactamase class C family)
MKTNLHCFAVALLVASTPVIARAAPGDPTELETKVDAIAADFLAKPGGVGLSIAVARKGELLLEKGYGLADAELDVKADASTLFRIGSITKQFTSAAIMRQVERRALALDDDLSKYVPSFPLQGKHVTIAQLLTHTSGIPSYTDVGAEWVAKWPLELTHDELLALVVDKPFDFEPGTKWAYDNTGYYLLGMVLEKLSGKSYADFVQAELFTPLKLAHTRYDSNVEVIKNRAQGYSLEKGTLVNDQNFGVSQPGAAGALLSTAGDLVRWQMQLTSGKVVSPESYARMSTPTVLPDGKNTHYGFGLAIDDLDGRKRIQHGGGIFGFNSMLQWYPDADVHVAVISNGEPVSSAKIADEIAYIVLGITKPAIKDEPISAERIAQLVGNYHIATVDLDARVFETAGKLNLQAKGQGAFRLLWQGGDEFRADFDDSVRLVFAADGQAFTLFQGGGEFQATRTK